MGLVGYGATEEETRPTPPLMITLEWCRLGIMRRLVGRLMCRLLGTHRVVMYVGQGPVPFYCKRCGIEGTMNLDTMKVTVGTRA